MLINENNINVVYLRTLMERLEILVYALSIGSIGKIRSIYIMMKHILILTKFEERMRKGVYEFGFLEPDNIQL
jgi:hypothetical protein